MPKKKLETPKREMTKRQLSHWQKQNKIQRFTLWGGIAVIVIVVALIATGIYLNKFKPFQATVLAVGDKTYSLGYYCDALQYYADANFIYISGYNIDYASYLDYTYSGVATLILQNEVKKEAAAQLDPPIVVSDQEIKDYIDEFKLSSNQAVYDAVYAQLLDGKLDDKFDAELPATAEHKAVLAMFLESQTQVDEIKARIADGETFNDIAKEESLDSTTKNKNGDLGWVVKDVLPTLLNSPDNTTLDDFIFGDSIQTNVLTSIEDSQKSKDIGYWLMEITDSQDNTTTAEDGTVSTEKEYSLNLMLLPSQEKADAIREQIENGADFNELAKTNSLYTGAAENGGALTSIKQHSLTTTLNDILFPEEGETELQIGEISQPIADTTQTTAGGFWLVQVTGVEEKALDDTNRSTLRDNLKNDWSDEVWAANSERTSNSMTEEQITLAKQEVVDRYNSK